MTKPYILKIFESPLSIYDVKITLPALENQYGGFYLKKYRKFEKIFLFFFFKLMKHIDLFQTTDNGAQNSCGL